MKFGLFSLNHDACSYPDGIRAVARRAEELGYESLWAGDHIVLPDPWQAPAPLKPEERLLEPVVALTFAAAVTERLLLGTGVIILPQRQPLVLAKQLASLDVLSKGRLLVGIGVGYLEPEFKALGVTLAERARRTDDYLGAMQAIWTQAPASFESDFVSFSGVSASPRPDQRPLPLVMGGYHRATYRRSVQMARSWYGFAMTPEKLVKHLEGLKEAADRYQRPPELGKLEITVTPRELAEGDLERYAAMGVDRVVLYPPRAVPLQELLEFVETNAP
ncbi:MAG: LLM class F420-dependent oxidoreductase [Vulcanimicrobiota bacterium]